MAYQRGRPAAGSAPDISLTLTLTLALTLALTLTLTLALTRCGDHGATAQTALCNRTWHVATRARYCGENGGRMAGVT